MATAERADVVALERCSIDTVRRSVTTSWHVVAQKPTEQLGQQFIVDNKPGACGNVGTAAAAKSKNDGCTLALTVNSGSNFPFSPSGERAGMRGSRARAREQDGEP